MCTVLIFIKHNSSKTAAGKLQDSHLVGRCDSSDSIVIRPRALRPKNRGLIRRRHNGLITSPKTPEWLVPIETVPGTLPRRRDWDVRLTSKMYLRSSLRKSGDYLHNPDMLPCIGTLLLQVSLMY